LVGAGAAIVALGLVLLGVAVLLRVIEDTRSSFVPTTYSVGRGFDLAHDVVLGGAFAIVCVAFLGSVVARERRLKTAAFVAACAFAASLVAQGLYTAVDIDHKFPTQLIVSDVLGALGALASIAAAAVAAVAFHGAIATDPSDQSRRDGVLGWSAVVLAIGLASTTGSATLYVDLVFLGHGGEAGLWIGVAGSAVGIAAGAVAAIALFASRRGQRRPDRHWMPRREALLAIALGVFFIAMALQGIGGAVTASAESADRFYPALLTAAFWLAASSALVVCAGAACAAIGFVRSAVSLTESA
jgi:hypothetical protein